MHPKLVKNWENLLDKYERQGAKAVFIEMGILVEAPWMHRVSEVWIVKAPREAVLRRLKVRGMSESDVLARMSFQPPPEEKTRHKTVFINNQDSMDDLKAEVEKLWKGLHN